VPDLCSAQPLERGGVTRADIVRADIVRADIVYVLKMYDICIPATFQLIHLLRLLFESATHFCLPTLPQVSTTEMKTKHAPKLSSVSSWGYWLLGQQAACGTLHAHWSFSRCAYVHVCVCVCNVCVCFCVC